IQQENSCRSREFTPALPICVNLYCYPCPSVAKTPGPRSLVLTHFRSIARKPRAHLPNKVRITIFGLISARHLSDSLGFPHVFLPPLRGSVPSWLRAFGRARELPHPKNRQSVPFMTNQKTNFRVRALVHESKPLRAVLA